MKQILINTESSDGNILNLNQWVFEAFTLDKF